MYKALVTDLDGTAVKLSSDGSDVTEDTVRAVKGALEQGKIVSCATGRGWTYAKPVVTALGLEYPCVVEGGTRIIDPRTEKTLWQKGMPDDAANYVCEVYAKFAPTGLLVDSGRDDIISSETSSLGEWQRNRFKQIKDIHKAFKNVRYLYLLGVTKNAARSIVNELNQNPEVIAHVTLSWQGEGMFDIHATHREATKEHAINLLAEMLNLHREEIIGFGDSGNDIPIFEAVGLKVATETGTEEVLGQADYIAPGPLHGGLKHVIETILCQ